MVELKERSPETAGVDEPLAEPRLSSGQDLVSSSQLASAEFRSALTALSSNIEAAEQWSLGQEQVSASVVHRFGPGIYIREVYLPAGTFAIGHHQRFEHTNVVLKGAVLMTNQDGSTTEIRAPFVFVGKPGRKAGYILEDTVWQNIYATEERDIGALEEMLFEKSEQWLAHDSERLDLQRESFRKDRDDYLRVLEEFGFTDEQAVAQSVNEADQIKMPNGGFKVAVMPSPIHGSGLFATADIEPWELIAPARISGMRTPAGRYTNHSASPNAIMVLRSGGDIDLVAASRIRGCRGGGAGEEVTIDYRQALSLSIGRPL